MKYFPLIFIILLGCNTSKKVTNKVMLPPDHALAQNLIAAIKSESYVSLKQNTVLKNRDVFNAYRKAFPHEFKNQTEHIDTLMLNFELNMGLKQFIPNIQFAKQLSDSDSIRYTVEHSLTKVDTNTITDKKEKAMIKQAIQQGFYPLVPKNGTNNSYNDYKFRVVLTSPTSDVAVNMLFASLVAYKGEWLFTRFEGVDYLD